MGHTAADLLEYADPAKIAVHLHATVQRILFEIKASVYYAFAIFEGEKESKDTCASTFFDSPALLTFV